MPRFFYTLVGDFLNVEKISASLSQGCDLQAAQQQKNSYTSAPIIEMPWHCSCATLI
jgi:hypothetical protein